MSKLGKCALCLGEGLELQDSHFLSAGVYRVTRDETEANPNPLLFNDRGAFQTSKQVTDYLLCRICEGRLNRNGEDWFLKHCWRRDKFLLHSMLQASPPEIVFPRARVYCAAKFSQIKVSHLAYFAASMFWRASVHTWRLLGIENKGIELGPYEEQFRKYLLAQTDFPDDCVLQVSIPENITRLSALSLTPYGSRRAGYHFYKLLVLGVGFHLLVGKKIPQENTSMCFLRGIGNPIFMTDMLEESITKDVLYKFGLHPELAQHTF